MSKLKKETIQFLKDLENNNNREWFDQNRERYKEAKADFQEFVQSLINQLGVYWNLEGLEAKDCIYRIFKDVRFSKDKTPYKAEFGATIASKGKKSNEAGVHLYIKPNEHSFIDFGTCHLEPDDLRKIRQEIDYDPAPLKKFMDGSSFKETFKEELRGDQLKTAPKGYEKDHPDIALLRYKNFSVRSELPTSSLIEDNFDEKFEKVFKEGRPFIDFLNSAILNS